MHTLISWLILSLSVYLTASILPGFQVTSFRGAIWVALLLGIVQFAIGWLLFTLFAIFTLGISLLLAFITRWIVLAILLKLVDAMSSSLRIRSFGTAILGGLIMSGIGTLAERLLASVH